LCYEKYLNFCSNMYLLIKLRSGTLKLNIELGRYNNTPRESRLFLCCNMNVVENEYHFVLVTQFYLNISINTVFHNRIQMLTTVAQIDL
jgi:hypothetical protein